MEAAEIKKRVRQAIDRVRRESAARRRAVEEAEREWEQARERAIPLFRQFAQVVRAEGIPFTLGTPAGALRLDAERAASNSIILSLDSSRRPAAVIGQTSYTRGQRVLVTEQIVAEGADIASLTDERMLAFLIEALAPFIER